jgi:hypothetical protein
MSDNKVWTPLQLQILLHYYCSAADFRDGDFSAPAVRHTIDWFRDSEQLLRAIPPSEAVHGMYAITERGRCLIDHILETPAPVQMWVIP